jgi:hypothetical protein
VPANPPPALEVTVFRTILSTLAAVALLGTMSTSAFAQQDLRMPDTRDAAIAATQPQDLRGPDAQDAARADQIAAQMRTFKPAPIVAQEPAPAATPSNDTPWAVIGISLLAALVAVGVGVMYVRQPRRNTLARS